MKKLRAIALVAVLLVFSTALVVSFLPGKSPEDMTLPELLEAISNTGDGLSCVIVIDQSLGEFGKPIQTLYREHYLMKRLGKLKKLCDRLKPNDNASIRDALRHENERVRRGACVALMMIDIPSDQTFYTVIKLGSVAHGDASPEVRAVAYEALMDVGWNLPDTTIPLILEGLKDADVLVRATAVSSLSYIGYEDADVIEAVAGVLQDTAEPSMVRAAAAFTLTNIGVDSEEVKALLKVAEKDKDKEVREAASKAIERLSAPYPTLHPER